MNNKQEIIGVFKRTLNLPIKSPNLIFLFLIITSPLFFLSLFYEIIFLQTLTQATKTVLNHSPIFDDHDLFLVMRTLIENISTSRLFKTLVVLGVIIVFDLINTIITVYNASAIYTAETNDSTNSTNLMNLKQMLSAPMKRVGLKGPLITAICVLGLSSLTLLGLSTLAVNMLFITYGRGFITFWGGVVGLLFGVPFMVLLTKYVDWSVIWDMGMVLSILEDKHGDIAIGVSSYLSKGCRNIGFVLGFVFFAWRVVLRSLCFCYVYWFGVVVNSVEVIAVKVILDCLGNFVMWVGFVVYFNDCKRRLEEKKFDGAQEKSEQV